MTLPSTKRPREVQEILEEEEREIRKVSVDTKIKVNLKQCFMDQMVEWHKNLNPKQKIDLTKRRVVKHACWVAQRLKLPYSHLPDNWVWRLEQEHGINFRMSNKRYKSHIGNCSPLDPNKSKVKRPGKIIDLTKEPPPIDWLTAYSEGLPVPPRVLKVFRETDPNSNGDLIVFYDYKAILMPEDSSSSANCVLYAHDLDGIPFAKINKNSI